MIPLLSPYTGREPRRCRHMPTTVARQRRLDKLLYEPNSTSVSAKQSRMNRELVKVLLTRNSGDHSAAPRVLVIQHRCLATGNKFHLYLARATSSWPLGCGSSFSVLGFLMVRGLAMVRSQGPWYLCVGTLDWNLKDPLPTSHFGSGFISI